MIGRRVGTTVVLEANVSQRVERDVVVFVKSENEPLRACILDSTTYDRDLDEEDGYPAVSDAGGERHRRLVWDAMAAPAHRLHHRRPRGLRRHRGVRGSQPPRRTGRRRRWGRRHPRARRPPRPGHPLRGRGRAHHGLRRDRPSRPPGAGQPGAARRRATVHGPARTRWLCAMSFAAACTMALFDDPLREDFASALLGLAPCGGSDVGEIEVVAREVRAGETAPSSMRWPDSPVAGSPRARRQRPRSIAPSRATASGEPPRCSAWLSTRSTGRRWTPA